MLAEEKNKIIVKNITKQKQLADKLNKQTGYARFGVGAMGGAAGEAFVADVEEVGSFGDMFDRGPTQLDSYALDGGREDATRKLMNRFKFASEGLLITPFVGAVAKGGKALATRGKDLAYSSSKFDRAVNKVTCSKNSIGLNLRIYEMSIAEYKARNLSDNIKPDKFNLWREITYYEYVREEIIKKKKSPNFPILYAFFISSGTGIDFKKLKK